MKISLRRIKTLGLNTDTLELIIKSIPKDFNEKGIINVEDFVTNSLIFNQDIAHILYNDGHKNKAIEFSIYCAELVLPIYEDKHNGTGPRKCIEIAKKRQIVRGDIKDVFSSRNNVLYDIGDCRAQAGPYAVTYASYYAISGTLDDRDHFTGYYSIIGDIRYAIMYASDAITHSGVTAVKLMSYRNKMNDKLINILSNID